ncbi:MAG: NAD(P)-binding protein [Cytophagales bacterium]|nr:NAD(P)-binding protein [Cytophagales bacterium]
MKRRDFLQISSLSLAALLVDGCSESQKYDVTFLNDMAVGHLVFESSNFSVANTSATKYLIAGGGIAGMSAAYQLRNEDFLLFELSDLLGGSSSGSMYKNIPLCHGAHYDLSYPSNYGGEVSNMLKELSIIRYDRFSDSWKFVDKQYLIPKNRESQTFAHGGFRKDVLPDGATKATFIELMKSFTGSLPMPTRLIDEEHRYLNNLTFLEWLKRHLTLDSDFAEGLDYHMKDDYGAGTSQVSALAGIHYFACRPYYTQPIELFSPPQGNSYFIQRIYDHLPKSRVHTSHLVKRILKNDSGFEVEVVDAIKKEIKKVRCEKIIYAGNKYALKYIYPNDFHIFQNTKYAPWVVANFILNKPWTRDTFWQNEIISNDKSLLGFVDSKAQYSFADSQQVFTVYYCFEPEEREMMSSIEGRKNIFIGRTLDYLENYFKKSLKRHVEKVFIKQMGHAMPIPEKGYLFNDANILRSNPNLAYAGVDTGRLPLLYEAMDSGITACRELEDGHQLF